MCGCFLILVKDVAARLIYHDAGSRDMASSPHLERGRDMRKLMAALLALMLSLGAGMAAAQQVVGGYSAWIGTDDLYNSGGQRLSEVWQVIRQDRANYHRFRIRQPGDEWDPFFADANNRADLERLVRRGHVERSAANALLRGNVMIHVTVYGSGRGIDRVDILVGN